MKAVTIRGVESEVAEKLRSKATQEGKSVNQLILEIIKAGLGLNKVKQYSREYDDLDDLFGSWTEEEYKEIKTKIDRSRRIDEELWQ